MKRIPNTFRNQPGYNKIKEVTIRWLNGETLDAIAGDNTVSRSLVYSRIQSFFDRIQKALRETDVMMTPEMREVFTYPFADGRSQHTLRANKEQILLYVEILEGEQYVDPGRMRQLSKSTNYKLDAIDTCPGCYQRFVPNAFTPKSTLCNTCNTTLKELINILGTSNA